MFEVHRKIAFLPYKQVWFAERPLKGGLFPPTKYYQCPGADEVPGYTRSAFFTLIHDLTQDPEQWLSEMNSSTRNEIRQIEKKNGTGALCQDKKTFLDFFNEFCKERGIKGTSWSKLVSLGDRLVLTEAKLDGKLMAMHAYLLDSDISRARLLFSASSRFLEGMEKNDIGKANRFLHFWDMKYFKEKGYRTYDWGGIAKDTLDQGKIGVNRFKEAFGGKELVEYNFTPSYLRWILKE